MTFKHPTPEDIRQLRDEQGISLHESGNILMKEAIIDALHEAKDFKQAKEALIMLARHAHIVRPHPASVEAKRQ